MIFFKSIFSRIIFLHVIALVITAIVMPGVDGLELLRRIRRMKTRPRVMVFGGVGHANSIYLDIAKQLGAEAVLSKPVVLSELRGHLARLTDASRARRENE